MAPQFHKDKSGVTWVSLAEASKGSPYSAEYLSLLARQRKIFARKINDVWYTTNEALAEYIKNRESVKKTDKKKDADVSMPSSGGFENWGYLLGSEDFNKDEVSPVAEVSRNNFSKVFAPALVIIFIFVATLGIFHKISPETLSSSNTRSLAAASFLDFISTSLDSFFNNFSSLRDKALGKDTEDKSPVATIYTSPLVEATEPVYVTPASAITQATPTINTPNIESNLRQELTSYINTRIAEIQSPVTVYQSTPVNTTILREQILLADTRPTITRQSDSDANRLGNAITTLSDGYTFTNPTITGGTFSGVASFSTLNFGVATGTSATTTNFFSTNGDFTNLTATNLTVNDVTSSGSFNFGNATTTGQFALTGDGVGITFYGTGNHDITAAGGTLRIGSNTIIGNITALDDTVDIGDPGTRFDKIYANEVNATTLVGTISGGNVSAETLSINSDNATADTEDSYLAFERGTVSPNALLRWDSTNKRFDFNNSVLIQGNATTSRLTATSGVSLSDDDEYLIRKNGANLDFGVLNGSGGLFRFRDGTDGSIHMVIDENSGNVGIGTSSPDTKLNVVKTGSGKLWTTTAGTVAVFDRSNTAASASYISIISGNTGLTRLQLGDTDSEAQGLVQYDNSSSKLSLWTSGTEKLTINSSGSVGIGTTNPGDKFTVVGSITARETDDGDNAVKITAGTGSGQLDIYQNGVSQIRLDPTTGVSYINQGNVGIGNTNPNYPLTISTTGTITPLTMVGGAATTQFWKDSSPTKAVAVGLATPGNAAGDDWALSTFDGSSWSRRMTVLNSSGNVGIGTTNPGAKLDVNSGVIALSYGYALQGRDSGGTLRTLIASTGDLSGGATRIQSIGGGINLKSLGGVDLMTILDNGNVGIGTTNPATKLDVYAATGGAITVRGDSENNPYIQLVESTGIAGIRLQYDGSANSLKFQDSGASDLMTLLRTGNVGIGTTNPSQKLDIFDSGSSKRITFNPGSTAIEASGGTLHINSTTNTEIGSNALFVQNNANVGIGTTNPLQKFQVNADPTNTSQPTAIYAGNADPHTALFISGTGNALSEKLGIQFGNYNNGAAAQYGIGGIYSVATNLTGNTIGDLTFDMRALTSDTALTERMRITSSGNVGIGTTNPGEKLSIYAPNSTTNGLAIYGTDNSNRKYASFFTNSNQGTLALFDSDGSTVGVRLVGGSSAPSYINGGNIGIGTTTPNTKLNVFASNSPIVALDGGNTAGLQWIQFNENSSVKAFAKYRGTTNSTNPNRFELGTNSSGGSVSLQYGAAQDGVILTSTGNIGIGTTTPSSRLQVYSTNTAMAEFRQAQSTTAGMDIYFSKVRANEADAPSDDIVNLIGRKKVSGVDVNTTGISFVSNTPFGTNVGDIVFKTNNNSAFAERMRLTGAGNLGIGTTTPGAALTVTSSAAGSEPVARLARTGAGATFLDIGLDNVLSGSEADAIYKITTTTGRDGGHAFYSTANGVSSFAMGISSNGNVGIGTTTPSSKLDINGEMRLLGATSGYVGLVAAAAAGSVTYTLPSADGTNGQVLTTDGAGNLTWSTKTEGTAEDFKGLTLRTSPDADIAAHTVLLDHADEIVMDTGNRVTDWDNLSAAITASGAGGLDTGSESASTWYEIYAIRNSSNGTKNLLLHRAKDYFLDETYDTPDSTVEIRKSTSDIRKLAQGFQVDTAGLIEFVDVKLIKSGSPTGRLWAEIQGDNGGEPDGITLATSDKIDVALISTSAQEIRLVFRTPTTLSVSTQYHLVLTGDWAQSDANYIGWRLDASSPTYADGQIYRDEGGTWVAKSWDASFDIYITRNNTSVTMPSGYDQKAKVGWVYNNSSSNFTPFVASGREVNLTVVNDITTVTETVPTIFSMSAYIPPAPVVMKMGLNSGSIGGVGGVPWGYCIFSCSIHTFSDGTNGYLAAYLDVSTEYQAVYSMVNTGTGQLFPKGYTWGSSGGADVAEEYLVEDETIAPGDVVSISERGSLYIERSLASSTQPVFGIVSTKPGLRLTDFNNNPTNNRAVALTGRIPVRISEENGPVKTGDHLTLSKTIPGVAMKQTEPGESIGLALESSTGKDPASDGTSKIMTFINLTYWIPTAPTTTITSTSTPNQSGSTPDGTGQASSTSTSTASSTIETVTTRVLDNLTSYIVNTFKDFFQIVIEEGLLRVAKGIFNSILVDTIEVDNRFTIKGEFCVDDVCVDKDQLKALLMSAGGTLTQIMSDSDDAEKEATTTTEEVIIEETASSTPSTTATTTEEVITNSQETASSTQEVIEEESSSTDSSQAATTTELVIDEEPEPEPEPTSEETASTTEEVVE